MCEVASQVRGRWHAAGLCVLIVAFLFAAQPSFGQIVQAQLLGAVTDTSGAAVPMAKVTVKEIATGVVTTTTTDGLGNYIFPALSPGNYTLTAEMQGFRTTVMSGIILTVDQKASLDVRLQIGAVTTQVEVSGAAPIVEATTASIGTVVAQEQILDLPLNGRRVGGTCFIGSRHCSRERRICNVGLWLSLQRNPLFG
jgi:hypothetical protein